ncbi:MAG TPA: protein translocase subunit SecF [Deltaproteobacteria bacterium]|nr:protein translocase subunit SecF [Deltaproteobacteria bacterium]HPJ94121.1 protein translocase subunit SecF [Deltaproteobacteria bacterium]HPR51502.1 protein translocase subunit SecF [Deltaproteobacteria bacterium]
MELIRPGTQIEFMKKKNIAFALSIALIVLSLTSIFFLKGINYGIDFAGGTEVQVAFTDPVNTGDVRGAMDPIGLNNSIIQRIGAPDDHEFLIRTPMMNEASDDISQKIKGALEGAFGGEKVDIRRIDMVGSAVSKDLKQKGFLSLFYAGIGILIYIWWRFEFKFSLGAILALIHDVIITVGIFSLTGKEINLPVIAALLTIVGYSLNDTIVVFDRIRENLKKASGSFEFSSLLDNSISQTLSRTLLTSFTTLIVVLCLYLLGGSVIHDFAFALMVGIIVGTYSSIFIASPTLLIMSSGKK